MTLSICRKSATLVGFLLTLLPAVSVGEEWIDLFGQDGIPGSIFDAELVGEYVVITGHFYSVGGRRASNVASYHRPTDRWDVIPMDLDERPFLENVAGLNIEDRLTIVLHHRRSLYLLDGGQTTEFTELETVRVHSLLTVDLPEGQRVVAFGEFGAFPGFGAVVWDGRAWSGLAAGIVFLDRPFIFQRNDREVLAGYWRGLLYVWDGEIEQTIDLGEDFAAQGWTGLNGNIVFCNNRQLSEWDGFALKPLALTLPQFESCSNIASRSTPHGDELIAGRWVSDGVLEWSEDNSMPRLCLFDPISRAGQLLLIDGGLGYGQLCVWDGTSWTDAMANLKSEKPFPPFTRLFQTTQGPFGWDPDPVVWRDSGIQSASLPFSPPAISTPSHDLKQFFSISDGNLQITSIEGVEEISLGSAPGLRIIAGMAPGQVMLAIDDVGMTQYFTYDGELKKLGQRIPGYSFLPELVYLDESSGTPGYFTLSLESRAWKSCSGERRYRIMRFAGGEWRDITPIQFSAFSPNCDVPRLSIVNYLGSKRLFAAVDERLGYLTEQGWSFFPENPGADMAGPIAILERSNGPCFFVGGQRVIHRLCGAHWSQPKELRTYLGFLGVQQLGRATNTTYQGRPVALIQGAFAAVGETAQPGFAVLDLDKLFADGLERPQ